MLWLREGASQGFSALPKFCKNNVYCPSPNSAVHPGASRAHSEWSFISPHPLLPFYSLPACVHGDFPVCFAFLPILFQLSDNLFFTSTSLTRGCNLQLGQCSHFWQLHPGPPFTAFLDHQLRLMGSRSLNSIVTA